MSNPKPLKPNQLRAIEVLVAGGSEVDAARAANVDRSTLYRWHTTQTEFVMQLQQRTRDETDSAKRIYGAEIRASVEVSLMGINEFKTILSNPKSPEWMRLAAAQSAVKNARKVAEKLDPELHSTEAIGRNDEQRRHVANEVTRQIAVWENRDRFLEQLQKYEQRRLDERNTQRDAEHLRRLNILARHSPEQRAYLYGVWRRDDDHEQALEELRRETARRDFAAAAGIELKDLPPRAPFRWADLSGDFEKLIKASPAPKSEEEAVAEVQRMQQLEYIDPNSPEGKARAEKFEEEFKKVEADYKANVLPKVTPSPIDRRVGSAGIPRPPLEEGTTTDQKGGCETPALPTRHQKWRGPVPDQDSPDRQAYLDSLGDDEVPELSETDRRRKADWDQRRKRSEENEKDCA
jgi:hypothetical protein